MNMEQRAAAAAISQQIATNPSRKLYAKLAVIERFPQYENHKYAAHCVEHFEDVLDMLRFAEATASNQYVKATLQHGLARVGAM